MLFFWGSFWYIRNWLTYGNPLYPFTLQLLGYMLWPGQGSVEQLVMSANTPPELKGLSSWQQVLVSWRETTGPYTFDRRLGGFGPQWLYLELPALVITLITAFRQKRKDVLLLIIPLVVLFWLQPSSWWARYTIFFVAAGALSIAYLEENLPVLGKKILKTAAVGLVLISLTGSMTHGYFSWKEINRFIKLPAEKRTFFQLLPWGEELAWIIEIPAGSRIAFTDTAFPYLLYGPRLENEVYYLTAGSEANLLEQLEQSGSQYFFTSTASAYYRWAINNPQVLKPFRFYGDFAVFRHCHTARE